MYDGHNKIQWGQKLPKTTTPEFYIFAEAFCSKISDLILHFRIGVNLKLYVSTIWVIFDQLNTNVCNFTIVLDSVI